VPRRDTQQLEGGAAVTGLASGGFVGTPLIEISDDLLRCIAGVADAGRRSDYLSRRDRGSYCRVPVPQRAVGMHRHAVVSAWL
jgi:hypothetical protein